jgi:hypothetical protein
MGFIEVKKSTLTNVWVLFECAMVKTSESFETLVNIKHTWIFDKLFCHALLVVDHTARKPEKTYLRFFLNKRKPTFFLLAN